MARTKKYLRKSQKRRQRGSKRRGQTGGQALGYSEVGGADTAGAGANMLKLVGAGPTQTTGGNGSIQVHQQTGGARRSTRKQRKLRGGSLMDALSSAIVPLALFGMNHKFGRRLRKKR
jgi:hypothetical protein